MQPTDAEISAALTHYRERIVSHNREAFTRVVRLAETAQPNSPKAAKGLAAGRLRFIHELLGISGPELHQNPIERIVSHTIPKIYLNALTPPPQSPYR
ncbi:hypothetical protein F4821DRAFT_248360 [Hypoxylon rubiginosum]|uniref:Uncharacterized protein n=1 Tax=Hypoxylon rubiginosum TaxID=110542 RepID=A0ACC0CNH7_9PEZI|nr:hypothetical protein F4821DRAFT_248360 [Hypoxylon rubiginosum]